jgi:hypothetical protein
MFSVCLLMRTRRAVSLVEASTAVERLGGDTLEVRLSGIYALERISKERPDDYWT